MPISTPRDANRIPTLLGTLNTNGSTVISLTVDPVTHRLKTSDGITGSDFSYLNAQRDANNVPAILGVKSDDGTTPIPPYVNSSGALLTKST